MRDGARVLTATLDELDRVPVAHGLVWRPIRRRFDLRGFGVNAYSAEEVGGQVVEEHTEESYRHEELYVVARGRAAFTLDGEEVDAPAVTLVHIPDPRVRRVATAQTEDTMVLALGGLPGEPFRVSPWESSFLGTAAGREGRWDEAVRLQEEAVREEPGRAAYVYNLACVEALAGRDLHALLHLQRAVELDPQAATWAQTDPDLASLRREQGFPAARAAREPEQRADPAEPRAGGWRALRLEELPERDGWLQARAALGFRPAGVNAWVGHAAGDELVEDHDERDSGHEELYLVLRGHARFTADGEDLDAPAGTLVAVDPRVRRAAVAVDPETTVLAIGAKPGAAFEPSEWELGILRDDPVPGEADAGSEVA